MFFNFTYIIRHNTCIMLFILVGFRLAVKSHQWSCQLTLQTNVNIKNICYLSFCLKMWSPLYVSSHKINLPPLSCQYMLFWAMSSFGREGERFWWGSTKDCTMGVVKGQTTCSNKTTYEKSLALDQELQPTKKRLNYKNLVNT